MGKIHLKIYQWILRAAVEILDLFPPRRIDLEEFALRKGVVPADVQIPESGTIWVHGASLGEVITLRPFLTELGKLYGRQRIVCTATTLDGLRQLRRDEVCGYAALRSSLPSFTINSWVCSSDWRMHSSRRLVAILQAGPMIFLIKASERKLKMRPGCLKFFSICS